MYTSLHHVVWIIAVVMLQGCVGLGAWTLGTRSESSDHPKIGQARGTVDLRHSETTEVPLMTATDMRTHWGEPDEIESREGGREAWIYTTGGLRWSGMVLYLAVVPLPAMIPVGSQSVSVLIHDGHIEQATRKDWAFKAGAYCGFFGMMYGGLGCGTGTFEEQQGSAAPADTRPQ